MAEIHNPMARSRRTLQWTARAIAVSAGALGLYLGYLQLTKNIHEVVAGKFYRSAQLSGEEFGDIIEKHGIRTIINLRTPEPYNLWYQEEKEVASERGIAHHDFPMAAHLTLDENRLTQLVRLFEQSEGPILVHCRNGADRAGLAAAVYQRVFAQRSLDEAYGQLSLYYGHFSVPVLSRAYPMDESWLNHAAALPVKLVN